MTSSDLSRCNYVVLRYVHDPVRDEAVNVGVILQDLSRGFVGGRFARRLRDVLPRVASATDVAIVRAQVDEFVHEFKHARPNVLPSTPTQPSLREDYFTNLRARFAAGRLRITTPRGSMTTNPARELSDLFAQFVGADADEDRGDARLRRLKTSLKHDLAQRHLLCGPDELESEGLMEDVVIDATRSSAPHRVDFAKVNGSTVVVESLNLRHVDPRHADHDAAAIAFKLDDIRGARPAGFVALTAVSWDGPELQSSVRKMLGMASDVFHYENDVERSAFYDAVTASVRH